MANSKLKILDVVALLKSIPEKNLLMGQVGTIVQNLAGNVFEVEFSDNKSETIATASVEESNLLLLHYGPETV